MRAALAFGGIVATLAVATAVVLRPDLLPTPAQGPAKPAATAVSAPCPGDPKAPAVTPVYVVDTRADIPTHARYGALQYGRSPLGPRRVAITIDDGPSPAYNRQVLDILDQHCLKATFFFVGRYAEAYPELVREVARRGHTIGTHSQNHPNSLRHYSFEGGQTEVRGGFAAAERALASAPPEDRARLAPFFRFPGLNDTQALLPWLNDRGIAVISAEAGTDDWRGIGADEIRRRGLKNLIETNGGVLIIHETRPNLVAALPQLITDLEAAGFTFVQLSVTPDARARAEAAPDPLLHPSGSPSPSPAPPASR